MLFIYVDLYVYLFVYIYNTPFCQKHKYPSCQTYNHNLLLAKKNTCVFFGRIFQALPLHYDATLARWLPWLPKEVVLVGGFGENQKELRRGRGGWTPLKMAIFGIYVRFLGCILLVFFLVGRFIHLSFKNNII